ncbi:MAG: GGDEF domain-containing protein [Actinomycetota bacterium]
MTTRSAALPAVVCGIAGLVAGVAGVLLQQPVLGAVAGVLAAGAGLVAARLAARLHEQSQVQHLVEEELRSVRGSAKATEASLREELTASRARFEQLSENNDRYADAGLDPLTDEITGLFSESFFGVALDSRVAAARRHLRPVAVVLIEVVEGLPTDEPQPTDATLVAEAVTTTLRESDTACRMQRGEFALLLEDTPENGAIWTVERIRRHLAERNPQLTMWAGVACYPAHAFSPGELLGAADAALTSAKEWRQDRIEVALTAAD